ncbi:MAG: hypothetical protein WKF47_12110 [Geodermatophilaceae bacterium]
MDIKQSFTDLLDTVVQFLPKLVGFLLILIIGYFIAKALEKILTKVLQKVGFDRLVERGGVKKALAKSQYDAAGILARLVFYTVMLFVLSTAFGVFGDNPISTYLAAVVGYLPKVFVAILIIVIAAAVAAGVKGLIQNTMGGLSYGTVLANAASDPDPGAGHHRCPQPAADRGERGQRGAVRQPRRDRRHRHRRRRWRRDHPDAQPLGERAGQGRGRGTTDEGGDLQRRAAGEGGSEAIRQGIRQPGRRRERGRNSALAACWEPAPATGAGSQLTVTHEVHPE